MPLPEPPAPSALATLPRKDTIGLTLHRIHRRTRNVWHFRSAPPAGQEHQGGRFDLPAPDGTCYTAASAIGAALETFQDLRGGILSDGELRTRVLSTLTAPASSPPAANLTAARARAAGITAGLWADNDRPLTQRWAAALRRAGFRSLWHNLQHDPTGRHRGVTLFDTAGEHAPYDDTTGWQVTEHPLHTDHALRAALGKYNIHIIPSSTPLQVITLDDLDPPLP